MVFAGLHGNMKTHPRKADQKNPDYNLQKDEDEGDGQAEVLCVTQTVATLRRNSGVLNVIVAGGLVCIVPAWLGTLRAFVAQNENHRQTVNFKRGNWRTSSQWAIRLKAC